MTKQTSHFQPAPAEQDIAQMRRLLAEMEALLEILPAAASDRAPAEPTEDETVEQGFDNMPV